MIETYKDKSSKQWLSACIKFQPVISQPIPMFADIRSVRVQCSLYRWIQHKSTFWNIRSIEQIEGLKPGWRFVGQYFQLSGFPDGDDGLDLFAVGPEDGDRPHGVRLGDDEAAPARADVQLVIVDSHRCNLQSKVIESFAHCIVLELTKHHSHYRCCWVGVAI